MTKLTRFTLDNRSLPVNFIETTQVKEGVECDVYSFEDDKSKDLGVISVKAGYKTPLQKVLKGKSTIEGYLEGEGSLTVRSANDEVHKYKFGSGHDNNPITVKVGETMQWEAGSDSELIFYEICEPPYEDGRFENI